MFASPLFSPAAGWCTATGAVTVKSYDVPRSWASNEPFVEQNALVGVPPDQTIPAGAGTDPQETFDQIGSDQVVLVATSTSPT
jgi:hypothetical protein